MYSTSSRCPMSSSTHDSLILLFLSMIPIFWLNGVKELYSIISIVNRTTHFAGGINVTYKVFLA